MKYHSALLCLLLLLLSPVWADDQADATEKAGVLLALIDAGEYTEAYQSAGKALIERTNAKEFAFGIEAAQMHVGPRSSRSFLSATHHASLPQGGDGNFYLLKWSSSFENLPSGHEVMILSYEDGEWKLAGYGMTP